MWEDKNATLHDGDREGDWVYFMGIGYILRSEGWEKDNIIKSWKEKKMIQNVEAEKLSELGTIGMELEVVEV